MLTNRTWRPEGVYAAPEGERVEVYATGWSSVAQGVMTFEAGSYRWRVWFGSEITEMWPEFWRPLPPVPTDAELEL